MVDSDSFKTTNLRSLDTVFVPDGTKLKPGVKICDGFVVGKVLSHGVQVWCRDGWWYRDGFGYHWLPHWLPQLTTTLPTTG